MCIYEYAFFSFKIIDLIEISQSQQIGYLYFLILVS